VIIAKKGIAYMTEDSNFSKKLEVTYLSRFAEIAGKLSGEDDAALETMYIKPNASKAKNRESGTSKDSTTSSQASSENSPVEGSFIYRSQSRTLSNILLDNQYLVLLGEPGSGKSITLQFLAWCFAREGVALEKLDIPENRVPILLSSKTNYWRDIENEDVESALRKEVLRYLRTEEKNIPDLVRGWLTEGKLIVLIDGIDEIPETIREKVVHELQLFANSDDYRGCRVVVTSRSANHLSLGRPFTEFTLQQFGGNDLIRLATAWLALIKDISIEEASPLAANLVNKIQSEQGLRNILGNPLFLKLLISIDPNPNQLPPNIGKVIDDFIRIYVWERAKKRKEPKWTFDECHKTLTLLAWILQSYTETDNDETRLIGFIEKNLPEIRAPREILSFLCEGMGLLEISLYSRIVRFTHAIFREYFVAWQLAKHWEKDLNRTWAFIKPRLHNPDWREPIFLISLILDSSGTQDYVSHIFKANSQDEKVLHRDKVLSGLCMARGAKINLQLRAQIAKSLLSLYLEILEYVDKKSFRSWEIPSNVSDNKISLEQILRNLDGEIEGIVQDVLAERINSDARKLYLREIISIVWSEALVSLKPLFRSFAKKSREDTMRELLSFRDKSPIKTRITSQLKSRKYYIWSGRVLSAIQAVGSLQIRSPKLTQILIEWLGDWRFVETTAIALSNQDVGTLEVASALLSAMQYHYKSEGQYRAQINFGNIINSLGMTAQKNQEIVEWLINRLNQPIENDVEDEDEENQSNLSYPIATAICKAAETNLVAFEFVLNYWNNLPARRYQKFDRDLHEGMKEGTKAIRTASKEIIKYAINQIKGYQEHLNHAPRLLDQILGEEPKVMQKEIDGRGNTWYVPIDASDSQIEEFQKAILKAITLHPLIGTSDETPLITIITRWTLESPSFLIRLARIVADWDARLLAENLSHYVSPKEASRWGLDKKGIELLNSIIRRLLDPDPAINQQEFTLWEDLAKKSESKFSLATWSTNVVKWQKCSFFYSMYWQTFGIFWMEGMGLISAGGWEKVKKWNPYSMAALASFSEWEWSSPQVSPNKNIGWEEAKEKFSMGTELAISFIKNHDNRVLDILKSLVTAKSPGNPDEAIFGDGHERRKARMDERIAAIYSLARLSRDFPQVIEFLFPIARKLSDIYIDDWDDAPVPFGEFREHLIRSLGYVYRPSREIVQLLLDTMKKDRESDWGHITIIEKGLEATENPSLEAVQYLINEYEKIENPYWKENILKPLSTVKAPIPEISRIMSIALEDAFSRRSLSFATAYFSNLLNLDTSLIDRLITLSAKNIYAMEILGNQARYISGDRLKRLAKITRRKTKEIGDDYRYILMKFQERLSELSVIGLPRELELVSVPISLKFIRGTIVVSGIILLLGLLVVLDTIYGTAQSTIQDFLGQTIKQWITTHPAIFILVFVGLGILIGLLSWLVEKLKERLK